MKYIIVITTVGSKKDAEELAKKIVSSKLGACVQINEIKSYYAWKGNLEMSGEFRLMIKTTDDKYNLLQEFIIKNSEYDLPQIIAVNIEKGYDKYLNWIKEELK
ncbi:MAG: divalent-cation tolerance protein CutA [Nanoarchaeota archaeon]